MTTLREIVTASGDETEAAGERFSVHLRAGDLVNLVGEFGAGKTTFVRGVARGLRVQGEVASPTFQMVRLHEGDIPLAHLDLYRIESEEDVRELGLEELLDRAVVVVEWANRLRREAPPRAGEIELSHVGEDRRRLRLVSGPAEWSF